jgi:hypothetical protein
LIYDLRNIFILLRLCLQGLDCLSLLSLRITYLSAFFLYAFDFLLLNLISIFCLLNLSNFCFRLFLISLIAESENQTYYYYNQKQRPHRSSYYDLQEIIETLVLSLSLRQSKVIAGGIFQKCAILLIFLSLYIIYFLKINLMLTTFSLWIVR